MAMGVGGIYVSKTHLVFVLLLHSYMFNPFPNDQIQTLPNLNEFADDNFIYDKIGRKFQKSVENAMGKGEIAHYEQFLLFLTVFSEEL